MSQYNHGILHGFLSCTICCMRWLKCRQKTAVGKKIMKIKWSLFLFFVALSYINCRAVRRRWSRFNWVSLFYPKRVCFCKSEKLPPLEFFLIFDFPPRLVVAAFFPSLLLSVPPTIILYTHTRYYKSRELESMTAFGFCPLHTSKQKFISLTPSDDHRWVLLRCGNTPNAYTLCIWTRPRRRETSQEEN